MNGYQSDFQVGFFPNPTKSFLNINKGTLIAADYSIKLIDLQGKVVFLETFKKAKQIEQINVADFEKGIYLLVLEAKEKKITKKIIVN